MSIDITVAGVAYPVPSGASDTDWAAQQVALLQALAAASLTPPTVLAPSLINSWANLGGGSQTAGYWKDAAGNVHLRGIISGGASLSICLQLPAGYRPSKSEAFPISANGGTALASIDTSGHVTLVDVGGSAVNTSASLCGITFNVA